MSTPLSRITASGTKRYLRDLGERVAWTFTQTFGATLVASGWFDVAAIQDLSIPQKAGVAGLAAVLAVVKGVVARAVGQKDSASMDPAV